MQVHIWSGETQRVCAEKFYFGIHLQAFYAVKLGWMQRLQYTVRVCSNILEKHADVLPSSTRVSTYDAKFIFRV